MKFDFSLEPGKTLENRYNDMKEKPLVSIITAYYNAINHFERTFNSVLNQTFPYFEWIIVNDGSTDEEDIKKLKDFVKLDSRIKLVSKENGGISSARNIAIENSTTDIIIVIDADDLMERNYVEYLYWALVTNPSASWSYCGLVAFGGDNYLWHRQFSSEVEKNENILIVSSAIRKNALLEVGCYSEIQKHYNEDWFLWLKLLSKGHIPVQISNYGFWYRVNNTGVASIVSKDTKVQEANAKIIQEAAKNVPDGIRAITFEGKKSKEFVKPKAWNWDRLLPYKEKKIKILLMIPHMEMGGADKFNLNLLKDIDKNLFDIGIITTVSDENSLRQEFEKYSTEIFDLPSFLNLNEWAAFIHYYIKSRQVDVVLNISSYYGYHIFPWLRKEFPDLGLIDYVHADAKYWRNGGYARVSASMNNIIEKTIVANKVTRDIMVEQYGKSSDKCLISYIGTDVQYFDTNKVQANIIKNKFGIKADRPTVLYICRLSQEKRPLLMVEIAREVKKVINDVCFLVVGDGSERGEIERKIKEYKLGNTVYLVGEQNDVRGYYKDADVLLICSIKEGLTLTTFEAMSMGVPVISSDVGGQKEIVNEKTGFLIDCLQDEEKDFLNLNYKEDEVNSYVNAICDLLNNKEKREKLSENCRRVIANGYNFKISVEDIQNEILSLANGQGLNERRILSEKLKSLDSFVDDYLTIYCTYENKENELLEIWNARGWFKNLYEESLSKLNNIQKVEIQDVAPIAEIDAQKRLNEIYSMRTWKLIQKYRNFMDHTKAGKALRKILNIFI